MNQEEKDILRSIAQALEILPSDKKERSVGYAEGVADMKEEMERRLALMKEEMERRVAMAQAAAQGA